MKKLTLLLFFLTIAIIGQERYVPGELLIQLKAGKQTSSIINQFKSIRLQEKELISDVMNVYLFTFDQTKSTDAQALNSVKSSQFVQVAQFNHYVTERVAMEEVIENFDNSSRTTTPNDPRFNEQWALNNTGQSGGTPDADIDAPEAWDFSTGGLTALGDTIVIAVVDGGVDLTHPDLNLWKNRAEIPGNNIDDDNNGYIDDYDGWNAYNNNGSVPSNNHGTHVSGITAARGNNSAGVSGVNWNAKVMPIAGSSGTESVVLKAYGYALKLRTTYNQTNGAAGAFVVVTNASFGVDYGQPSNYPLWCAFYDSLGAAGILSCGATANANINVDLQGDIPTACPSNFLISVTNTTNTDAKNSGAAYGLTTIDLGAPGTSILNTTSGGSYGSLTGTSMATPTVAGAVALMFAAANASLIQSYKANPAAGALAFKQFLLDGTDPIPSLQNITVTGGRLNVYKALLPIISPPDTIPPTAVNNLSATDITSNKIKLMWTAPYDTTRNGVIGYNIRYSTSPITNLNDFNNATAIPFPAVSDTAGTPRSVVVQNLNFATAYYFALRATDLWGNWSPLSNVVNATTLAAPSLSVSPDSIHILAYLNHTYLDTVTVANVSSNPSTLNYSVELTNNTFPSDAVGVKLVPINKIEPRTGKFEEKDFPKITFGGALEGFGGPDAFGYKWIDSDESAGPLYVWNDISTTGTLASTWIATGTYEPKDEGYAGPFDIGFNFKFYGVPKTQIYVSSNGFLTFGTLNTNTFTNASIPNSAVPNNIIAPFWDDLDGRTQGTVHYKQEGNKFTIQFTNWQKYSATGSLTFQVVLYANGSIFVYYNNMNATLNSATVGIENEAGAIGLQVAYNANYVKNNHAIKFAAEPDWLHSNNNSGMLFNGNSAAVQLEFNTTDLTAGEYSMSMVVTSNDPQNATRTIPIRMTLENDVPVELTSFTANRIGGTVELNWSTATETNNYGFEVLRTTESSAWEIIGFVNGNGTTTEAQSYQFKDDLSTNVVSNSLKYRLRQIDFDGTFELSKEIEVASLLPEKFSLEQNFPNPFNPATVISFSLPSASNVTLKVFNSLGEIVEILIDNEWKEAGYHNYQLRINNYQLTTGVYFYRLQAGEFIQIKKMILSK